MKLASDTTSAKATKKKKVEFAPTDDQITNGGKEWVGRDEFLAKKSASYKTEISSDKDVWCEYLAVVEIVIPENTGAKRKEPRYELRIKSFFESTHTGKRSWDEPPSGATTIQYATDEERTRAKNDKEMLQTTTRSFSSDAQHPKQSPQKNSKFRLRNIFNKIRRTKKTDTSDASISSETSAYEQAIQKDARIKAMKRSEHAAASKPKKSSSSMDEQDAIAMAKALSLSERESDSAAERDSETMMQKVLNESESEAYSGGTGLAYGNTPQDNLEEDEGGDSHLEEVLNMKLSQVPDGKTDNACDTAYIKRHATEVDADYKMPAAEIDENWGKQRM